MASNGTIGSLAVNIVARTQGLQKGIKQAQRAVDQFSGRIKKSVGSIVNLRTALVGLTGGAGFGLLIKQQFSAVDALAKTSDKLGIATEALAGLRHAAELSGVATNTLDMGLQRMVRRVAEAAQGTGEAQGAIRELGLDAQRLAAMSPDQQFASIADALNKVGSQSDRVRLAFKLFDSEGVALVNVTRLGSKGLAEMQAEAAKLGIAISRTDAAKIEAANDAVTRMREAFKGVFQVVAVQLAPGIEQMAAAITASVEQGGALRPLFESIADAFKFIQNAVARIQIFFFQMRMGFNEVLRGIAKGLDAVGQFLKRMLNNVISLLNKLPGVNLHTAKVGPDETVVAFRQELARSNQQDLQRIRELEQGIARRNAPPPAAAPERAAEAAKPAFDAAASVKRFVSQIVSVGSFFGGLTAKAPAVGTPAANAALEAGSREAFIASRQGRQDTMKTIAEEQKKEVKLSEVTNGLLKDIKAGLSNLGQTFSIPLG